MEMSPGNQWRGWTELRAGGRGTARRAAGPKRTTVKTSSFIPVLLLAAASMLAPAAHGGSGREDLPPIHVRGGPPLQFSQVRRVEIRNREGTLILERADAEAPWRIEAPFRTNADDAFVTHFVRYLLKLRPTRQLEAKPPRKHLKEAGLRPPFATVRLFDARGLRREVRFGDPSSVRDLAFVEKEDGIWLAPSSYRIHLDAPFSDFRDRRVLRRDPREVVAMTIKRRDGTVRLRREADGWRLAAPESTRVRDRDVDAILKLLAGPVVIRFLGSSEPSTSHGLDRPQVQVEVELDDGSKTGVAFGDRASGAEFYGRLLEERAELVTIAASLRPPLEEPVEEVIEPPVAAAPEEPTKRR